MAALSEAVAHILGRGGCEEAWAGIASTKKCQEWKVLVEEDPGSVEVEQRSTEARQVEPRPVKAGKLEPRQVKAGEELESGQMEAGQVEAGHHQFLSKTSSLTRTCVQESTPAAWLRRGRPCEHSASCMPLASRMSRFRCHPTVVAVAAAAG